MRCPWILFEPQVKRHRKKKKSLGYFLYFYFKLEFPLSVQIPPVKDDVSRISGEGMLLLWFQWTHNF